MFDPGKSGKKNSIWLCLQQDRNQLPSLQPWQ
jgi:hypothetical protein